jgi:hypothetical protein
MEELLISTLETLGYPIRLQGSLLANEKYPDHFFTYWNNSTEGESFYSNKEGTIIWDFSLNFYSIDPLLINNKLLEAKVLLKNAGFIVSGAGYSVISDENTHTGRGISVIYRQTI